MTTTELVIIFIALSFFYYGASCLFDKRMKSEFQRFGIPQYRRLIGISQLLASLLMAIGYFFPIVALIAAIGLAVQMLMGFLLRLKIKDGLLQSSPAFLFMILNAYLAIELVEAHIL